MVAWLSHAGYTALFLAMALQSAAIPLPSEVILPFGGYLVSLGRMSLVGASAVAVAGSMVGSVILYAIGVYGGRPFLDRYGRYVALRPHHLATADAFFSRHGEASVFVGRLLPIVRTYVSLPAGIARMPLAPFLVYSFLGSIPWTVALLLIGQALGTRWQDLGPAFHVGEAALVLLAAAAAAWLLWRRAHAGRL